MTDGGPKRDKSGWSMAVACFALIAHEVCEPHRKQRRRSKVVCAG
ncbi:MAG: hypothetical protein AAGF06_02385 [Pseudomonadota bacterium]